MKSTSEYFKRFASQAVRNSLRPYAYLCFRAAVSVGRLLGHKGSKPSFIVIGTQKGGTTTLFDALCQHSKVKSPRTKELSFFDRHYGWGKEWYFANFPNLDSSQGELTGEATPDYMFMPNVAERIERVLGKDIKFIVLLRNPVDRAISHYFHEVRLGSEDLSLEAALDAEKERMQAEKADLIFGPRPERLTNRFCFSYRSRSEYSHQLPSWFERFGRESFYVCKSEDFFADPERVRDDVLEFLGLSPEVLPEIKSRNVGTYGAKVSSEVYRKLSENLADEKVAMETLVNKDSSLG